MFILVIEKYKFIIKQDFEYQTWKENFLQQISGNNAIVIISICLVLFLKFSFAVYRIHSYK